MEDIKKITESAGFAGLHPAVQCTLIVCTFLFFLGFYLGIFTDFWNNISRRK